LLTSFEGQVKNIINDCVILSHYHNGVNYHDAFELSPYEKQLIAEFIEQEQEREMKLRSAYMGRTP
jgi:hypothetical protein